MEERKSPLEKFVEQTYFQMFGMCVIILNCVVLCLYLPLRNRQPQYVTDLNTFVDVYFVFELIIMLIALGVNKYFVNMFRVVDCVVGCASFVSLLFKFITAVSKFDSNASDVSNTIKILRILRILRPLKMMKFLPSVMYQGKVLPSIYDLLLNIIIPALTLVVFALVTNALIGQSLQYRCVPSSNDDTLHENVVDNEYYKIYGIDYFYSQYNSMYCGSNQCDHGYECEKVQPTFQSVYADFSTPWNSFISNTAFLTLRGWPHTYWAIVESCGALVGNFTFLMIVCLGGLIIFNMFKAVFISFLKAGNKHAERVDALRAYPGDVDNVSELELILWARRNERDIYAAKKLGRKKPVGVTGTFKRMYSAIIHDVRTEATNEREALQYKAQKIASRKNKGTTGETVNANNGNNAKKKTQKINFSLALSTAKQGVKTSGGQIMTLAGVGKTENSSLYGKIKGALQEPHSAFNNTMKVFILLNIILWSIVSNHMNFYVAEVVRIGNIVFASIFGLQLTMNVLILGPFAYFNDWVNLIDGFVIIYGLYSLNPNSANRVAYVNIFRIIFFMHTSKEKKRQAVAAAAGDIKANQRIRAKHRSTSLTFSRIFGIITESALPILVYFLAMMSIIYIFSIVGMVVFPQDYYESIVPSSQPELAMNAGNTTLTTVSELWSGQYASELNFNLFTNAFVAVFNIMTLNSWYTFMMIQIFKGGRLKFWYFFFWIFCTAFMLTPFLVGAINVMVENYAVSSLRKISDDNEKLYARLGQYTRKSMLYRSFHKFKRNSFATSNTAAVHQDVNKLQNQVLQNEIEDIVPDHWLIMELKRRNTWSLYIFPPADSKECKYSFRGLCKQISTSIIFNVIVIVAIVISIALIMGLDPNSSLGRSFFWFVLVVYSVEFVIKVISLGFIGTHNAYMRNFWNVMDLCLLVALFTSVFTNTLDYPELFVMRVAKFPAKVKYVVHSPSMTHMRKSIKQSVNSLAVVVITMLLFCFFFAVFTLNMYNGGFGHCSYDGYPEGRHFSQTDPDFYPNGCDGTEQTPVAAYIPNEDGILQWQDVYWVEPLNGFDNIIDAAESIFRAVMMNEWAGILLDSLSFSGKGEMPSQMNSKASFLVFLAIVVVSLIFEVLFGAVIYYHFLMNSLLTQRNADGTLSVVKRPSKDDVIWKQFDIALAELRVDFDIKSLKNDGSIRYYVSTMLDTFYYRFISIGFAFVPVFLVMSYYEDTYGKPSFYNIDAGYSVFFMLDFLLRVWTYGKRFTTSKLAKQEFVVVIVLILTILWTLLANAGAVSNNYEYCAIYVCIILRTYRLAAVFPQIGQYFGSVLKLLVGFLPVLVAIFSLVLFFTVLVNASFGSIEMDLGDPFLNKHYGFQTMYKTFVTLLAMGTGNIYTELLEPLKENRGRIFQFFVNFIFVSYYIVINTILKSIVILLISKFMNQSGDSNVLADQQLNNFKRSWEQVMLEKGTPQQSIIDKPTLHKLVTRVRHPIGLKGDSSRVINYRVADRYVNVITSKINSGDSSFYADAVHRSFAPNGQGQRVKPTYTYNQVLTAMHKHIILDNAAPDRTIAVYEARQRERLRVFRRIVTMDIVSKRLGNEKNEYIFAGQMLLQLQRVDPSFTKAMFCGILGNMLSLIRQNIQSFGFQDFDGFLISMSRRAVQNESLSATLQLHKEQLLNPHNFGSGRVKSKEEFQIERYCSAVDRLAAAFDKLYDEYIEKLWDVRSLRKIDMVKSGGGRNVAVTAVAVCCNNRIYTADSNGCLKIWALQNKENALKEAPVLDVKSGAIASHYSLVQTIEFDKSMHLKYLSVSTDAKRIFACCGSDIVIFGNSSKSQRRGKSNFHKMALLSYHSKPVTSISVYDRFLLSAAEDGMFALWNLGSDKPVNYFLTGSRIFCMTHFAIPLEQGLVVDELSLTHCAVCGLANGTIQLLPLPLAKGSPASAANPMVGMTIRANKCPVSSVCFAWGFLYAGCADGSIKVFCSIVDKSLQSLQTNPISMLSMVMIGNHNVHSGPVTGMVLAGGYLFSGSHDCSVVPWRAPAKLGAKSAAEFRQESESGQVYTHNAILFMSCNKDMLVLGDEGGCAALVAPKRSKDMLRSRSGSKFEKKAKFHLSFLEYNFKACFISPQNLTIEEETHLHVTNMSDKVMTIRSLSKWSRNFRVDFDSNVNRAVGCSTRMSDSVEPKRLLVIPPGHIGQIQIAFAPTEAEKNYSQQLEFLVDENTMVKVQVSGVGAKPALNNENDSHVIDYGIVHIDDDAAVTMKTIKLSNSSQKDLVVALNKNSVEDKFKQGEFVDFNSRNVSVTPEVFIIRKQEHAVLDIKFSPKHLYSLIDMPLRFTVAHNAKNVATIRIRSSEPLPAVASPNQVGFSSGARPNSISSSSSSAAAASGVLGLLEGGDPSMKLGDIIHGHKEHKGLRPLEMNENHCPLHVAKVLLRSVGWYVNFEESENNLCLMHAPTGLFLDLRDSALSLKNVRRNASLNGHTRNTRNMTGLDHIIITLQIPDVGREVPSNDSKRDHELRKTFCLFFGEQILTQEHITSPNTNIEVSVADLNSAVKAQSVMDSAAAANANVNIKASVADQTLCGIITLELHVYEGRSLASRAKLTGHDKSDTLDIAQLQGRLQSITYINVQKGYVVSPPQEGNDQFELSERFDVIGIHRHTSFLKMDGCTLFECFDQSDKKAGQYGGWDHHQPVPKDEIPIIARAHTARLAISPVKGATNFDVDDVLTVGLLTMEEEPDSTIRAVDCEIIAKETCSYSGAFDVDSSTEMVILLPPELPSSLSESHDGNYEIQRVITVKTFEKAISLETASQYVVSCDEESIQAHAVMFQQSSPTTGSQFAQSNNTRLPSVIHSGCHSVQVKMKTSLPLREISRSFTDLQDQIRSGIDFVPSANDSSLQNQHWYFITRDSSIQLVSAYAQELSEEELADERAADAAALALEKRLRSEVRMIRSVTEQNKKLKAITKMCDKRKAEKEKRRAVLLAQPHLTASCSISFTAHGAIISGSNKKDLIAFMTNSHAVDSVPEGNAVSSAIAHVDNKNNNSSEIGDMAAYVLPPNGMRNIYSQLLVLHNCLAASELEDVSRSRTKTSFNYQGLPSVMHDPPNFLVSIFEKTCHEELATDFKIALRKLMEKIEAPEGKAAAINVTRAGGAAAAASTATSADNGGGGGDDIGISSGDVELVEIAEETENDTFLDTTLASVRDTTLDGIYMHLCQQTHTFSEKWAQDASAAAVAKTKANASAMSRLVDSAKDYTSLMTSAAGAVVGGGVGSRLKKGAHKNEFLLPFNKFLLFLENTVLPGQSAPTDRHTREIVLRGLQVDGSGNVTKEQFRYWYRGNESAKELSNLNEQTLFARMLADELGPSGNGNIAHGLETFATLTAADCEEGYYEDSSPGGGGVNHFSSVAGFQVQKNGHHGIMSDKVVRAKEEQRRKLIRKYSTRFIELEGGAADDVSECDATAVIGKVVVDSSSFYHKHAQHHQREHTNGNQSSPSVAASKSFYLKREGPSKRFAPLDTAATNLLQSSSYDHATGEGFDHASGSSSGSGDSQSESGSSSSSSSGSDIFENHIVHSNESGTMSGLGLSTRLTEEDILKRKRVLNNYGRSRADSGSSSSSSSGDGGDSNNSLQRDNGTGGHVYTVVEEKEEEEEEEEEVVSSTLAAITRNYGYN